MNAKLEDELRVALNARADAVPHSVDPWALTSAAIRTDRRLRRTRAAGGLVAVLALGLAIPTVLDATDSRKPEPAQTITIQPGPAITGGIQSWTDARGSLAKRAQSSTRAMSGSTGSPSSALQGPRTRTRRRSRSSPWWGRQGQP